MILARSGPEIMLIGWGFLLNGIWEFLQSPLYADHDRGTLYIVWSRLHCTARDVLILLGAYWITYLMFRTRSWPADKGFPAWVVFVGCGFYKTGGSPIPFFIRIGPEPMRRSGATHGRPGQNGLSGSPWILRISVAARESKSLCLSP
jgi:hypothetical protein